MLHEKILQTVTTVMIDALGVDEDEVAPEATLLGDLGAESIDLLDIQFRMEHEFGLTLNVEDIPGNSGDLSSSDLQDQLTVGALEDFVKYCLARRVES